MKRSAVLAVFVLCLAMSAAAQRSVTSIRNVSQANSARQKDDFPRTRFDPTRDPNADLKDAIASAAASHKRIILDIGGEWCVWCRLMDRYLYENKPLGKIMDDNFIWVKINVSLENENRAFLAEYPEISGYPHLFVLDETGKLLVSQDTSEFESGESYSLKKFTAFLNKWAAAKTALLNDHK